MAAVLMSRYGPGAYPSLPLQTCLLKSLDAVRERAGTGLSQMLRQRGTRLLRTSKDRRGKQA
jgi:hypothetical protein